MKVKELLIFLSNQDLEKEVFIDAYEGGFSKLSIIREAELIEQSNYIGAYSYYKDKYSDNMNPLINAIVITAYDDEF